MANLLITEQQLSLIKEYSFLEEAIINEGNFTQIKSKLLRALLVGALSLTSVESCVNGLNMDDKSKMEMISSIKSEYKKQDIFNQKVNAVRDCMESYAKLNGYDVNAIPLSPEALVKACDKHDYDLPLALAQAKLESVFGLAARALRTKSVWSIGSFDNGKNLATYPTANDSIEPYINVMKSDYLANKSIDQMLTPGNMVNQLGQRYASDKNYETTLRSLRNKIIQNYPILTN